MPVGGVDAEHVVQERQRLAARDVRVRRAVQGDHRQRLVVQRTVLRGAQHRAQHREAEAVGLS